VPLSDHQRQRLAFALLWITPLVWSSNYLIARAAHGVVMPHLLAFGRWGLAFALMLPWAWRGLAAPGLGWRGLWSPAAPWRAEWRQLLVLGALGMWICGAFVYIGAQTTPAANIALLYAATPIAIAVVGARLLHDRLGPAQWAGVACALTGVLFVIAQGRLLNLGAVTWVVGDLWVLVAAVAWTAYSLLLRLWPSRLGTAERLVAITAGGLVVLVPFTLAEWWWLPRLPFTPAAAGLVVAAAVLPGVLAYQAYSFMQAELGVTRTGLVLYLGPVYSAFTAWLLLGEPPRWYHGVGAALILPSIWLATRTATPQAPRGAS
jgi:drug/metabolite transporter (DMT)-like permease